ncbi:MAG TPA: Do family serine endopeptidase [Bacteroidales bacterium]|nr:Do family serine endopeptidase [Bacteroidales bacterium]
MRKHAGILVAAILGGLIAIGLYAWLGGKVTRTVYLQQDDAIPQRVNFAPALEAMGMNFTEAAERTVNGVVHIRTEYQRKSSVYDYFFDFRDFFNVPQPGRSQPIVATGSGVIVSPNGYIVTNNHVVSEADQVEVTLNDKRSYKASVIGTDPTTDLALLKVDAEGLPFIQYGNSDEVRLGEWVLAVGNPFNLTSTVTAGIVSAKARNINILANPEGTSIESFIQTDAAVNRGNSGGALVNVNGELVGINAAIASGTGYYAGYSFAIPVNIVRKVVSDLMEYGVVQRGFIGVSIQDVNAQLVEEKGLPDYKGVFVNGVSDGGAASAAGVRDGDVILEVEGFAVNHTSELLERIGQHRPGEKVNLLVRRGNKEIAMDVTLRNQDNTTAVVKRSETNVSELLGAELVPVSAELRRKLGISHGIMVKDAGNGRLRSAGIRSNYIILFIDNKPVKTVAEMESIISKSTRGVLFEGIYPDGTRAYYGFGLN